MADTEPDTDNPGNPTPVAGGDAPAQKTDITVPELRKWLREWVGRAVGKPADEIDESVPMVELGLSSRDAVAMAADIEDMTGVTLSVAVAFQHPTIESLATRIIEGEPEIDLSADGDITDWSRKGPAERVDIAVVGLSTRFPGDMDSPDETWQALLEGRDAITDLPEGRWSEFLEEPRLAERVRNARTRGGYLKDIKGFDSEFFAVAKTEADNIDPQQRMALELTWEALEYARIPPLQIQRQHTDQHHRRPHQHHQRRSLAQSQ
jgi:polyketide synthase 13